ncbi:MAG: hypothetical protein ACK4UT_04535, partial [Moraxellaceae bacterium]
GTVRPPSPVLAELLDQVQATVALPDAAAFRARFITRHPLQPFSPRYFAAHKAPGDEKLFSYAPHFAKASGLVGVEPAAIATLPAFTARLPPASDEQLSFTPARFEKFLAHPARHFLRERLGVQLPQAEKALRADEPVDLTDRRALRRELYRHPARSAESLRAAGLLPGGTWGDALFAGEQAAVADVRAREADLRAEKCPPVAVDVHVGRVRWSGLLDEVTTQGLVRVSLENKLYPTDLLCLRFLQLLLAASGSSAPQPAHLVGLEATVVLPPVQDAHAALLPFAEAAEEGLCLPLPLFRRASPLYVQKNSRETAYDKGWCGSDYAKGDGEDVWNALLWRDSNPCDERFAAWADRLYRPLLDVLKDVS